MPDSCSSGRPAWRGDEREDRRHFVIDVTGGLRREGRRSFSARHHSRRRVLAFSVLLLAEGVGYAQVASSAREQLAREHGPGLLRDSHLRRAVGDLCGCESSGRLGGVPPGSRAGAPSARSRRLAGHVHFSARPVSRAVPAARPHRVRHVRVIHGGDLDTGTSRPIVPHRCGWTHTFRSPLRSSCWSAIVANGVFRPTHRSCTRQVGQMAAPGSRNAPCPDFRRHLRVSSAETRGVGSVSDPRDEAGGISSCPLPRT